MSGRRMRTRFLSVSAFLLAAASVAFGAVTAEPAGAPPAEADAAIAGTLQKEGVRIKDGDKVLMELWFRAALPKGAPHGQPNVTLADVPHGAVLGVARFPARGSDRRGQTVKPGVYTMRLSFFPENGDHQGAAPQRDFLVLSPAGDDKDVNSTPDFEALMNMSRKASGTPHPLVLSMWKQDPANFKAGVAPDGEHDQALQTKIGDQPIAVIVQGVFNH
jgi:hypothetical protein